MAGNTEAGGPPLIYLNNAATSWPKPHEVLEEVARCLQTPFFELGRSTAGGITDYPSATRDALAGLLHAGEPGHFIFTGSATDSLNLLIHGFVKKEKKPFHAITTELEHNSVLRPLHSLAGEGHLSLSVVPFQEGHVTLHEIKKAIRPETRLVVMTHGSNVLGSLQDIRPIAEYCRANDIFLVVDGAQTAGQVPINLSAIPAGAFVFTGHKALFGIPGIGGFYLNDPEAIAPVRQGGTGTDSHLLSQPVDMPQKFETGTPNYPGIASLLAGIRYIEREGVDTIARKCKDLLFLFIKEIKRNPDILLYTPAPDLPVVSFNIRNLNNDETGYILGKAYNIVTRTGLHCAPLVHDRIDSGKGCVRVSFSHLTTPEECLVAAGAVREVAEGADR
ncbi:aminotransferase class V-fold PLP-dependent enzyme [Methanoregula sp.]|uniref:aminotransferase class V-fold PLP-dependent enzyme n=1 Tax=Methanoregula sp. TaxID=2052170 RepID=UPI002CDB3BB2|nr:aminotransferase class V-fold PLP-dependent enzyme [Methanoregula sp.]HVP97306.1 aminotransferase class V-fold PLP-dependent enzyme [Methanoregula sp.]